MRYNVKGSMERPKCCGKRGAEAETPRPGEFLAEQAVIEQSVVGIVGGEDECLGSH